MRKTAITKRARGRPPEPSAARRRLTIRLTDQLFTSLHALADHERRKAANMAAILLEDAMLARKVLLPDGPRAAPEPVEEATEDDSRL